MQVIPSNNHTLKKVHCTYLHLNIFMLRDIHAWMITQSALTISIGLHSVSSQEWSLETCLIHSSSAAVRKQGWRYNYVTGVGPVVIGNSCNGWHQWLQQDTCWSGCLRMYAHTDTRTRASVLPNGVESYKYQYILWNCL